MFWIYEMSNWCVNLAGFLILQRLIKHGSKSLNDEDQTGKESFMVSHDLQVLLFIGQVSRAYWGLSPPEIWLHDETPATKIVVLIDFSCSVILWSFIALFSMTRKLSRSDVPWKLKWPTLTIVGLMIAGPGSLFIQPDVGSGVQDHAFPLADLATVFNLTVDVLAILPQLWIISQADGEFCSSDTRDFVGLLGLARIFRMSFWSLNWLSNFLDGMPLIWLIPFIVPDFIHTMVMGQYVWLWIKKVRRDNVELSSGGSSMDHILGEQEDVTKQNILKTIFYLCLDTVRTLGLVCGRVFCAAGIVGASGIVNVGAAVSNVVAKRESSEGTENDNLISNEVRGMREDALPVI